MRGHVPLRREGTPIPGSSSLAAPVPFSSCGIYSLSRVQIDRRTFLEQLGAITLTPALAGSQEARGMWGMIAKITLLPGKRDEMIEILIGNGHSVQVIHVVTWALPGDEHGRSGLS